MEPGHVGADLVMGSFIKNPGVRHYSNRKSLSTYFAAENQAVLAGYVSNWRRLCGWARTPN